MIEDSVMVLEVDLAEDPGVHLVFVVEEGDVARVGCVAELSALNVEFLGWDVDFNLGKLIEVIDVAISLDVAN